MNTTQWLMLSIALGLFAGLLLAPFYRSRQNRKRKPGDGRYVSKYEGLHLG